MRGSVISAVVLCFLAMGKPSTAGAQPSHRVVVEPFSGASAPRFRSLTIAALVELGHQVVPDADIGTAATKMGLKQLSDNYSGLASDLQATLFVDGVIGARARKVVIAQLKVKNRDGVVVGTATWRGGSPAMVMAKIRPGLPRGLKPILDRQPDPAGAVPPMSSAATSAAEAPPPDPLAAGGQAAPSPPSAMAVQQVPMASGPPDGEAPPGLTAAANVRRYRRGVNHIDLSVGTQLYARTFAYIGNRTGAQQNYQVVGVPAPNVAAEYFFLPFVGITASAEYSVPVVSRDVQNRIYKTGSVGYSLGGKLRLSSGRVDVMAGAAFGENTFTIGKDGSPDAPQVADVSYQQLKGGASTRIALGRGTVSVIGGGNYLHLLGVGELKDYFPYVTGSGGEGYAGLAIRLLSKFEVRATGHIRAYIFRMNSVQTDQRDATGAVDQYLGLNLAVAVRD